MKIFIFIRQCLHAIFPLYSKSICMPIILSEIFTKNIQYYWLSYVISMIPMYFKILSFIRKCFHFIFQLHPKCVYMPIYFLNFFPKKFNLAVMLCNPQFCHTYDLWNLQFFQKMSLLSASFIFLMHLYSKHCICVFSQIIFILSIILHNPQFLIHKLYENLQIYKKMFTLQLSIIL